MISSKDNGVWWLTIEAPIINPAWGGTPRDLEPADLIKSLPEEFYYSLEPLYVQQAPRRVVLTELSTLKKREISSASRCRNALETALFYEAQRTGQPVEIAGYRAALHTGEEDQW